MKPLKWWADIFASMVGAVGAVLHFNVTPDSPLYIISTVLLGYFVGWVAGDIIIFLMKRFNNRNKSSRL